MLTHQKKKKNPRFIGKSNFAVEDTCSGVRLRAQDDSSGPLPAPTYRERDAPPRHFCHMDRRRRIYHLGGGSQLATSNCSRSCRCVSSSSGKLPKRLHELTCFFAPDKVVIPSSTPSVILSVSTAISSLDLQGGNLTCCWPTLSPFKALSRSQMVPSYRRGV